jgi:hypothetical protein
MCHAYSITTNVEAIRQLVRDAFRFEVSAEIGNMPPQTGVYPGMVAPIIRRGDDRSLLLDRVWWGMPSPQNVIWKRAKQRADRLIEKHHQRMSPDGQNRIPVCTTYGTPRARTGGAGLRPSTASWCRSTVLPSGAT